uniref:Uncharacterized protein n=1 Tax=Gopherus evgoodei TaxID=1825980 RepID=A0A8C4YNJ9_9SAUR
MEEVTPTSVSCVSKEKPSKVSDLISRFEGGGPSSPSDLKKESSVVKVAKSQGRYESASPQPKLISQHPLQKQGNNTDQTQVVQKHTANGVVAQSQMECNDNKLLEHSTNTSTPASDIVINSNLVNGEQESTTTEPLQATMICTGQTLDCCRTPGRDTLFPSENETVETNTNVEEKQNEELSKEDEHVEAKETDEQKRHKIADELLHTERAYVSRLDLLDKVNFALRNASFFYLHILQFT